MNFLRILTGLVLFSGITSSGYADGFDLKQSLEKFPHLKLQLTEAQIQTVGTSRHLHFTKEQIRLIREHGKNAPDVVGVMTRDEPDCSCHIAPAFWIERDRMIVWLNHIEQSEKSKKWYLEVRNDPRRYMVDVDGNFWQPGREISRPEFEAAVEVAKKAKTRVQVSLSPNHHEELAVYFDKLNGKKHTISLWL